MTPDRPHAPSRAGLRRWIVSAVAASLALPAHPVTPLSDGPVTAAFAVPGNVVLALSVEYPTAISVAHLGAYTPAAEFLGYFDARKCYRYVTGSEVGDDVSHFRPAGLADGALGTGRTCNAGADLWSGNFLNWATMQTIDPFRMALTGGYRRVDTPSVTILERAWASDQGGGNFPDRLLVDPAVIAGATPAGWGALHLRVAGLGDTLHFASANPDTLGTTAAYTGQASPASGTTWAARVRVRVCDASTGTGGLEANCMPYDSGFHKPEGLLQRHAERMRFSAFGYLNDNDMLRDGAVLRARQKFVGPGLPRPGAPTIANPGAEWSATTGVFASNPDAADAADTATLFGPGVPIANSGVLNYLNKFGQINRTDYKVFDPVGELYYAAVRYLKNLGNVPAWSSPAAAPDAATRARWADGFPVITSWGDPIQYACQRNFILGIGDVHTHADKNLPGPTPTSTEPPKPAQVAADTSVDAMAATNQVGRLHGLGTDYASQAVGATDSRGLMAGLAYDSHTRDMRPDLPNPPGSRGQTVETYWLDVMEYQYFARDNPFYLAAKFGGFTVPPAFDPYTRTEDLPIEWWSTSGDTVDGMPRPDNYFTAGDPQGMVDGLTAAFERIAAQLRQFTTVLTLDRPQTDDAGSGTYAARYDTGAWSGDVIASRLRIGADGMPTLEQQWSFAERLAAQAAGSGWNDRRRIVTRDPATGQALPLRWASLPTALRTRLDAPYTPEADGAQVLDWLRGDRSLERGPAGTAPVKTLRARTSLVGDIIGSRVTVVGAPNLRLDDATNPGYSAFRAARASRPTMVYFGANDGLVRGVRGDLTGTLAGREVFAYVPGVLFAGPSSPATPGTDGLVALAHPNYRHRHFVNATPQAFDIDFSRTRADGGTGLRGGAADWRTVLAGGLGKGGRAVYALDVTDPGGIRAADTDPVADGEADAAARVLWEFTDPDLGFTVGDPVAVRTRQHGWVLVFGSGHNNASGQGFFFVVNPRTGALIQKIGTGAGAPTAQAGLAHVAPFFVDRTDGLADAVYAGDLLGNVWRLDLRATTGAYPAPVRLAQLTDATVAANPQPVTSAPLIEVNPVDGRRHVLVGTGRLLDATDIARTEAQSLYAIHDGSGSAFAATGPVTGSPAGFPVRRQHLAVVADTRTGVAVGSDQWGWVVDLGTGGSGGVAWRSVTTPAAYGGLVVFGALLPEAEPCGPSGRTRVHVLRLLDGRSALPLAGTTREPYVARNGLVTDLKFVAATTRTTDGAGVTTESTTARLIGGNEDGTVENLPFELPTGMQVRRVNWREVATAQ